MNRPRDAVATEEREGDLQGASPEESARIRRIEDRQDFPGAVISGYNDDAPPDFTPIPDMPGWDAPEPPTLPYDDGEG